MVTHGYPRTFASQAPWDSSAGNPWGGMATSVFCIFSRYFSNIFDTFAQHVCVYTGFTRLINTTG